MRTSQFRVGGAVLGAVADEAHSSVLLPITGVHHVHVQPSDTCAQGVIRCVAAAALDLGPHSLPARLKSNVKQDACQLTAMHLHLGRIHFGDRQYKQCVVMSDKMAELHGLALHTQCQT